MDRLPRNFGPLRDLAVGYGYLGREHFVDDFLYAFSSHCLIVNHDPVIVKYLVVEDISIFDLRQYAVIDKE